MPVIVCQDKDGFSSFCDFGLGRGMEKYLVGGGGQANTLEIFKKPFLKSIY